jgi:hypothetical protein
MEHDGHVTVLRAGEGLEVSPGVDHRISNVTGQLLRLMVTSRPTQSWRTASNRSIDMICRIWRGWTSERNANAYERLLRSEIFTGIASRHILGFRSIDLLRRESGEDVEFTTIMWFDSLDAVRAFAGVDYEVAVVPISAQALLSRFDERSAHHDVRERRSGAASDGLAPTARFRM